MERPVASILWVCAPIAVGLLFSFGALHLWRGGRELRERGVTVQATVARKFRQGEEIENYYARFAFADAQGRPQGMDVKVRSRAWRMLREGGVEEITYIPGQPEKTELGPRWARQLLGGVWLFFAAAGGLMAVVGVGLLCRIGSRGGKVDPIVIVTMAVFGALAATLVFLSRRQGVEQRSAMEQFAAGHGWQFLGPDASRLRPPLDQVDPNETFQAWDIVPVEGPPGGLYLFAYNSYPRQRPSSRERGYACLADGDGAGDTPVFIHRRIPVAEHLLGDKVDAGSPEFRREYVVTCSRPEVALRAVNGEVQRILLEHAAGPQWSLLVRIAGRRVLITTSWAQKPEEWDYLIGLTRKLKHALLR